MNINLDYKLFYKYAGVNINQEICQAANKAPLKPAFAHKLQVSVDGF